MAKQWKVKKTKLTWTKIKNPLEAKICFTCDGAGLPFEKRSQFFVHLFNDEELQSKYEAQFDMMNLFYKNSKAEMLMENVQINNVYAVECLFTGTELKFRGWYRGRCVEINEEKTKASFETFDFGDRWEVTAHHIR